METRRASLKDSYQFILDDLDRAAELLELEEDFNTDTQGTLYDSIYFNEYTMVYALHARVLLYMKRWTRPSSMPPKSSTAVTTTCRAVRAQPPSSASYYKYMADERLLHRSHLESGLYR